jgi:glyoxylase-like metal-dependent hydrolase (beta-lactamase superfamily II)
MKTFIHPLEANTYIWCYQGHCLLIDPADSLDDIKLYLKDKVLDAIVLTHAHADHMHLIDQFDTVIYLHPLDFPLLKVAKHIGYPNGFPYTIQKLNIQPIPSSIKLGDKTIEVILTPGHSPGSISLYDGKVLVSGDVIFKGSIGRTDLYLGNESHLKLSIKNIMSLPSDVVIYPGHGEKTTVRHEKSHNLWVQRWLK